MTNTAVAKSIDASTYDVAIVGYGPVGAMFANLLARDGFRVAVIEREREIYDKPRAMVIDHEISRVLQSCGLADTVHRLVTAHPGTDFVNPDGEVIMQFDPMAPPYPLGWQPTSMFIQPEFEAVLRDAVGGHEAVDVLLGWQADGFVQDSAGVSVACTDCASGAAATIKARYLVGCDGANSSVRKQLALPVQDLAFDEWWIVVDTWFDGSEALPEKCIQYCHPARPATFIRGPRNLRRWEIKLLPGERPEDFADEARIVEQLSRFVSPDAIEIWRAAVYRFHAVVAEQWRAGRVFIMGDAAHQMPPFMGQGMCSGMRDAANLAWKLRFVERQGAKPDLLDSYSVERRPHITELTKTTKEFGEIIGILDEKLATSRHAELKRDLNAGTAETVRQNFIPGLSAGLADFGREGRPDAAAGSLFVQPRVDDGNGRTCLLDDQIGPNFMLAARSLQAMDWLTDEGARIWRRIGGRRVVISGTTGEQDGVLMVSDTEGLFEAWCRSNHCDVALVRPDGYVYGTANDARTLHRLVGDLDRLMFD
jgi:3-(3-hydroxy-phenyl)propionate hydroxylase